MAVEVDAWPDRVFEGMVSEIALPSTPSTKTTERRDDRFQSALAEGARHFNDIFDKCQAP